MPVTTDNTGLDHFFKGFEDSFLLQAKKKIIVGFEEEDRGFDGLTCCNVNYVTAYPTDPSDKDKNDYTQALFRLSTSSDTITQELWKDEVFFANLTNDTYGRFWALGDITGLEGQELLAGYEIDWLKVYNAVGGGKGNYQIKTNINSGELEPCSAMYRLVEFSNDIMDGWIRIESTMNGTIDRTGIIYKGLNLKDVLRVPGIISAGDEEWEAVYDIYQTTRKKTLRRADSIATYDMKTHPLYKCTAERLTDYHTFADEIFISDYNKGNYCYINRKEVIKEEGFEGAGEADNQNRKQPVVGVWKEKRQDNLKTVNF